MYLLHVQFLGSVWKADDKGCFGRQTAHRPLLSRMGDDVAGVIVSQPA